MQNKFVNNCLLIARLFEKSIQYWSSILNTKYNWLTKVGYYYTNQVKDSWIMWKSKTYTRKNLKTINILNKKKPLSLSFLKLIQY